MSSTFADRTRTESIRQRLERQYVVVTAPVELDASTVPAFAERLFAIEPNSDIVVDLRDVNFCGASAISMLVEVERHVVSQEGSLTLSSPTPVVDRLLEICGLEHRFQVRRPAVSRRRSAGGADPSRR